MITLIPGKIGSKGVPLKNLRDLGGYPLIMWSVAAANLLSCPVFVTTDSHDVEDVVSDFVDGVNICDQKGDKFIIENLIQRFGKPEVVIYLRPTTPFRDINVLKHIIGLWHKHSGLYSLRTMHEMTEPCGKMYKVRDDEGSTNVETEFTPYEDGLSHDEANKCRQDLKPSFYPNGYIDITQTEKIDLNLFGEPFLGYLTEPTIEIDTEEQLEYAQYWVKKHGHPLLDYMKAVM